MLHWYGRTVNWIHLSGLKKSQPKQGGGKEENTLHPEQLADPVYYGGAGICWKHEEGKLLKPVLLQRRRTRSCRLSSYCQPCSQPQGLGRTFILVAAHSSTGWGKTGNWNMEGNEDWSFTKIFFGMPPVYAIPHHQLPTSPSVASVQICVLALSERRRAFYWCWVTSNQDWFPSIAPNVAAGASVLAQERRGGDKEEERGQQLI